QSQPCRARGATGHVDVVPDIVYLVIIANLVSITNRSPSSRGAVETSQQHPGSETIIMNQPQD
ncbi:hypothetical protein LTS12_028619, partial [Elasticomyces elasticus]